MPNSLAMQHFPLGPQWPTQDPFLFCAYHLDHYPASNGEYGPASGLDGRPLGQDFTLHNGYRMYHGQQVPGFPVHPHRGFETITLVREGFVDHADSLGSAGRYSAGDVQWMTAGGGIQHSEMFPLLDPDAPNTLELLQIWINLPGADKRVPPGYKMFWSEEIPVLKQDADRVRIEVIAGSIDGVEAIAPPERSWAADPANEVALWIITMAAGAEAVLPAADGRARRTLYNYRGQGVTVAGARLAAQQGVAVAANETLQLVNGDAESTLLVLQGRPVAEPVAQHGPFVMNTRAELQESVMEYQRTAFGGWPWPSAEMVHGPEKKRWGRTADGQEMRPPVAEATEE